MFESGGDDVLGHAVQPLSPFPCPVQPPRGEPLVGPPTQEQGLGAQRFVQLDPGPFLEVLGPKLAEPAAPSEAFLTGRVLDDSIERYVLADHDRSHHSSPFMCVLHALRRLPRRKLSGEFRAAPTSLPVMRVKGPVLCEDANVTDLDLDLDK